MIISINYVLIAVVSFVISLITVYAISRLRNPKLLAPDVHKPYKVLVPKIGGVSVLTTTGVITLIAYLINDARLLALGLVTLTVGLIGLVDDLRGGLPVSVRVFLPLVPSLIIPRGRSRLHIHTPDRSCPQLLRCGLSLDARSYGYG